MKRVGQILGILVASLVLCSWCAVPTAARADNSYSCGTYSAGDYQAGSCDAGVVDQVTQPITNFINNTLPATGTTIPVFIGAAVVTLGGLGVYLVLKRRRKNSEQENVSIEG